MSCGTDFEQKHALLDVQAIIAERGLDIYLRLEDEGTIERDEWGSVKKRTSTPKAIKAFPVNFSPTQKEKDDLGIKEAVDVTATTAMQDWIDLGFTDKDLSHIDSIRAEIVIRGQTYEIKDKNFQDQFTDTYLYVILGLNRK